MLAALSSRKIAVSVCLYLVTLLLGGCSSRNDVTNREALASAQQAVTGGGLSNASLQLQVLTNSCGANQAQQFFRVVNTGATSVKLSDIKVKFWVDDTSGQSVVPHVWTGGCVTGVAGNPSCVHQVTGVAPAATTFASCGPDATHQANWEFTVSTTDSTLLPPGAYWNNLQVALNLANYANFNPGSSMWFSPCLTGSNYAPDSHFAVYYQNQLVFSSGINAPDCRAPHGTQPLSGYVTPPSLAPTLVGPVPATTIVRLAIGLPIRDPAGLQNFIHQVSNPSSPTYRQYKSLTQVTADYGPLQASYTTLTTWAQTNGLTVVTSYPNRILLDVSGPASAIEKALYVNLNYYLRPDGSQYYGPDRNPSPDLSTTISGITRLNDIASPKPAFSAGTNGLKGNEIRNAYIPCASALGLDGNGQCVGIVDWNRTFADGDIAQYMAQFSGLPQNYVTNYNVQRVALPDYSPPDASTGVPFPKSSADLETPSDIELALTVAPAATIVVYEGANISSIFNAMLTDQTRACNQLSSSWTASWLFWTTYPQATIQNTIDQMAATGKSIFQASGDQGAYTDAAGNAYGTYDNRELLNTTVVGGTQLTVNSDGTYQSEIPWALGGGGYLPDVPIPDYQQGIGTQASSTYRNLPDVAMVAQGVQLVATYTGKVSADCSDGTGAGQPLVIGGTSLGAPLWAGVTALINQRAANAGLNPVGFLNANLYSIGKTPQMYSLTFNDVVGSAGAEGIHWYWPDGTTTCTFDNFTDHGLKYSAVAGYDLATGLGSPKCGLIELLATGHISRRLAITGSVRLDDCFCHALDCTTNVYSGFPPVNVNCDVSATNPTASFSVGPNQLCYNELGVQLSGTCTLLGDMSIDLQLAGSFYHGDSNSCGGGNLKDSQQYEFIIPAGASQPVGFAGLEDSGNCYCYGLPYPCDNWALTYDYVSGTNYLHASNQVGP